MNISRISVSRKQVWDQCKLKYRYQYHLELEKAEAPFHFTYGKIVHKIAELYVAGAGRETMQSCCDDVMKGKIELEKDGDGNPVFAPKRLPTEYQNKLPKHLASIQNLTEKLGFEGELEWKFEHDLDPPNGKTVLGFIDRLIAKNDEYRIVDYKTTKKGRFQKDHLGIIDDLQLRIYARIVQLKFGAPADKIKAALFYLEGSKLVPVQYSQSSLERAERELLEAYDEIKETPEENAYGNVGDHCRFCDWRKICPFYSLT